MKKTNLIYLLLFSIVFSFSCDNDDEGSSSGNEVDPIIGTWRLTERTEDGMPISIEGCEVNNSLEFLAEGGITDIFFEPNFDVDGACVEIMGDPGSWEMISESEYQITLDGGDIDFTAQISFTENNTQQEQVYTFLDGDETFSIVDVYERIE